MNPKDTFSKIVGKALLALVLLAASSSSPAQVFTTLDNPQGTNGTFPASISNGNVVGFTSTSSGDESFYYNGSTSTWTTPYVADPSAKSPQSGNTFPEGISGSSVVGYYQTSSIIHRLQRLQLRLSLQRQHLYHVE